MQLVIEQKSSGLMDWMQGIWDNVKDMAGRKNALQGKPAAPFMLPLASIPDAPAAPKVVADPQKIAADIESGLKIGSDRRLAMNKENMPLAIKERIAALVEQLGNEDFKTREKASVLLTDMGYKARSALLDAVSSSENPEIRTRASAILVGLDGKEKLRVRGLVTSVKSIYDSGSRPDIYDSSRPEAKSASPALMKILKEEQDPELLKATVGALQAIDYSALAQVPEAAKQAVPSLIAILQRPIDPRNPDRELKIAAVQALGAIKADPQNAVPALAKVLETEEQYKNLPDMVAGLKLRGEAARALGSYGLAAKEALPALIKAASMNVRDEGDYLIKLPAISALGKIKSNPEKVVPVLIGELKSPIPPVRMIAAIALSDLGPDAVSAKGAFIKALKNRDMDVIPYAISALISIGRSPKATAEDKIKIIEALNEFRTSTPDKDEGGLPIGLGGKDYATRIREQAAEAIKILSETLKDVAPASPPVVVPPLQTPVIPQQQNGRANNG